MSLLSIVKLRDARSWMEAKSTGYSPLHLAALCGQNEQARILIDKGADLNARSKNQITPLHLACAEERGLDVALMLIEAGADVTLLDAFGLTPFDMPNGRAVRDCFESRLAAKAISDAFGNGLTNGSQPSCMRGLRL